MAADVDTDLVGSADGSNSLNPSGFHNPYHKVVGTPVTDKVLSWWEELHSNKLYRHKKFKEELLSNQVPVEQEKYFKAPELTSRVKSSFKEARSSLVTQDDKLRLSRSSYQNSIASYSSFWCVSGSDMPRDDWQQSGVATHHISANPPRIS